MANSKLEPGFSGWVYILTNPAFPGLVKIGQTKHCPHKRARDLSGTGLPTPWVVAAAFQSRNHKARETEAHILLAKHREKQNREFFRLTVDEAKRAISQILDQNADGTANCEKFKRRAALLLKTRIEAKLYWDAADRMDEAFKDVDKRRDESRRANDIVTKRFSLFRGFYNEYTYGEPDPAIDAQYKAVCEKRNALRARALELNKKAYNLTPDPLDGDHAYPKGLYHGPEDCEAFKRHRIEFYAERNAAVSAERHRKHIAERRQIEARQKEAAERAKQ